MDAAETIRLQGAFLHAAKSGDAERAENYFAHPEAEAFLTQDVLAAALREAAHADQTDMVYLLIANKAPLDQQDEQGFSAIDSAAWNANIEMLTALLDAGASLNVEDEFGYSPELNAGHRGASPDKAEEVRKVVNRYKGMSDLRDSETYSKKTLFTPQQYWRSHLDNPSTWRRIDKMLEYFADMNDPIEMEDMLKTNSQGATWLQRSVDCYAIGKVLPHLHQREEYVRAPLLLDDQGAPTELMLKLAKTRQLPEIFTLENWQGASPDEIKLVYNAVPEEWRSQVKNLHTLVAETGRQLRQERAMRAIG